MTLLRRPQDWVEYTAKMATNMGITSGQVIWGTGPQQYPCLVASIQKSPMQVTSCYIYLRDAIELCQAAGYSPHPKAQDQPSSVPGHTNRDFEKHVSALVMTVISELISVGATTKERFETRFAQKLAVVDQMHEADKTSAKELMKGLFDGDHGTTEEG